MGQIFLGNPWYRGHPESILPSIPLQQYIVPKTTNGISYIRKLYLISDEKFTNIPTHHFEQIWMRHRKSQPDVGRTGQNSEITFIMMFQNYLRLPYINAFCSIVVKQRSSHFKLNKIHKNPPKQSIWQSLTCCGRCCAARGSSSGTMSPLANILTI